MGPKLRYPAVPLSRFVSTQRQAHPFGVVGMLDAWRVCNPRIALVCVGAAPGSCEGALDEGRRRHDHVVHHVRRHEVVRDRGAHPRPHRQAVP